MAGQFIDRGGKVHDLEDVSKITFVDRDGNAIYEGNYGDTITYQQDGQTKTKKLTETRRLLGFMDGLAAGDYSYMPITIGDAVQGASLEMMTNSAKYVGGKVALTVAGGAIGSIVAPGIGTAIGASIGMMISNLGADAYMLYDAYTEDPDTFWNKYVDNIKDVARGADSNQEPNATGWRRWLSEINTGMSYIGMGGKEAVHETWDDVIGAVPEYTVGNMFGNVVRSLTAGLPVGVGGSTMSYVIDQALNDGLREAARNVGITNDIKQAAALGSIYGFGAGITAWGFTKLALADKGIFKKLNDVSPFLGNPLANSAEAALGQLSYDFIVDVVDPTQDRTIEDYGINTGLALAMGYGMSALPAMWSKIRTKNLENAVKNIDAPTQKDVPTAKEAVENKINFEEVAAMYEAPEIKFDSNLQRGRLTTTKTLAKELQEAIESYKPLKWEEVVVKDEAGNEIFRGGITVEAETGRPYTAGMDWIAKMQDSKKSEAFERAVKVLTPEEQYSRDFAKYQKEVEKGTAGKITKKGIFVDENGRDITPEEWIRNKKRETRETITARESARERESFIAAKEEARVAQAAREAEAKEFEDLQNLLNEYKTERALDEQRMLGELEAMYSETDAITFDEPLKRKPYKKTATPKEERDFPIFEKYRKDIKKIMEMRKQREEAAYDKLFLNERIDINKYGNDYKKWYSDNAKKVEKNILRGLGYDALGGEFVNDAQKQIRKDAIGAAYAELTEAERNAFAKRVGFNSFDEFVETTPTMDLLEWNKKLVDVYDVPVYNPTMPALSNQQKADIIAVAVKKINNGMQPEIAVYQSFAQQTRIAPDRETVEWFVDMMPKTIRLLRDNKNKMLNLIQFMDYRAQKYIKGETDFTMQLTLFGTPEKLVKEKRSALPKKGKKK